MFIQLLLIFVVVIFVLFGLPIWKFAKADKEESRKIALTFIKVVSAVEILVVALIIVDFLLKGSFGYFLLSTIPFHIPVSFLLIAFTVVVCRRFRKEKFCKAYVAVTVLNLLYDVVFCAIVVYASRF
jgi:hypothetical protein